jgi:raffinose/stachyose/melibiose transport system substrate-binding protein
MEVSMKKNHAVFLVIAMVLLVATFTWAGGGKDAGSSSRGKTVLQTLTQGSFYTKSPAFGDVCAYIESRTGIAMEWQLVPEGFEGEGAIKAKNAAGDLPDLLVWHPGFFFRMLNPTVNFVDVTDQPYTKRILPGMGDGFVYDGRLYGIPYTQFPPMIPVVLYNKKVFASLGLSVPKNWDEFIKVCETIKVNGKGKGPDGKDIVPMFVAGGDAWQTQPAIWGAWAEYAAARGKNGNSWNAMAEWPSKKSSFADTPIMLEGMSFIRQIIDRGYANADASVAHYEDAQEALALGKCAMNCNWTQINQNIYTGWGDKVNDISGFAFPFKNGGNVVNVMAPAGIYIPKTTPASKHETIYKWMDVYTTGPAQDVWFEKNMGMAMYEGITKARLFPCETDVVNNYVNKGNFGPDLVISFPVQLIDLEQICQGAAVGGWDSRDAIKMMDENFEKSMKLINYSGW